MAPQKRKSQKKKPQFRRKVTNFSQVSDDMWLLDRYIRDLNRRLDRYNWGLTVTKKPGGGTPPPPPKWP